MRAALSAVLQAGMRQLLAGKPAVVNCGAIPQCISLPCHSDAAAALQALLKSFSTKERQAAGVWFSSI